MNEISQSNTVVLKNASGDVGYLVNVKFINLDHANGQARIYLLDDSMIVVPLTTVAYIRFPDRNM